MTITITDKPNITTIKIVVKGCNKENLKEYAKRLEKYIQGSIYPWYYYNESPFVLFNTGSFIGSKSKDKIPFEEVTTAYDFIQNAINKYEIGYK